MARIRSIKPEFPQSEDTGKLSRDARLLFIQLWTVSDDYGRVRAAIRALAGSLYPYDDDAVGLLPTWLNELEGVGLIQRYTIEGSSYLHIKKWSKHQRIDNAGKSHIPPPPEDSSPQSAETRGEPPRTSANDGDSPLDLGPRSRPRNGIAADAVRGENGFEEFFSVYPKRDGDNPRSTAERAYGKALKTGVAPADLLLAAQRFAKDPKTKVGSEFVPQAATWLNQKRWERWLGAGPPGQASDQETYPTEIYGNLQ